MKNSGGSVFLGEFYPAFFQLLAGMLDHLFGDGNFVTILVDDRAAYRCLRVRHGFFLGIALLQAHFLSPHQVASSD
ncbi:protein of unknown function [Pseudomonas sp. JV241A]|nr:protein of unknown function [Pseudomonas sp. JV241A]